MKLYPDFLNIGPFQNFNGTLRVPGSKSISNRALLLAALSSERINLKHLLFSDDTLYMLKALETLGLSVQISDDKSDVFVQGVSGNFPNKKARFFLGNSGTSMRSLAAALCIHEGEYILEGEARMYERPIKDLADALKKLGAEISYLKNPGFPPLEIHGKGLLKNKVSVKGNISSQYLTALLLCAPFAETGLSICVDGELISKPYIEMTLSMMHHFGIEVQNNAFKEFKIPAGVYKAPSVYEIEGDASSASYPLAAAAISKGYVKVEGLKKDSLQGDIFFAEILKEMGARIHYGENFIECSGADLHAINKNLNAIPDAAMTVAVLALFAKGTSTISGIKSWKVKETDRLSALSNELQKTGAKVSTTEDSITITPPEVLKGATFETYNDHRMAMCMSLVSLGNVPVRILNPSCVNKTYPEFFDDFLRLAK